jgi:hypothetical protein
VGVRLGASTRHDDRPAARPAAGRTGTGPNRTTNSTVNARVTAGRPGLSADVCVALLRGDRCTTPAANTGALPGTGGGNVLTSSVLPISAVVDGAVTVAPIRADACVVLGLGAATPTCDSTGTTTDPGVSVDACVALALGTPPATCGTTDGGTDGTDGGTDPGTGPGGDGDDDGTDDGTDPGTGGSGGGTGTGVGGPTMVRDAATTPATLTTAVATGRNGADTSGGRLPRTGVAMAGLLTGGLLLMLLGLMLVAAGRRRRI